MTTDSIPVIDFSPFIDGDAAARAEVARQMRQASSDWGFFYLSGCGMPAAGCSGEMALGTVSKDAASC